MTVGNDWLTAFPIKPAHEAVEALCESWRSLAGTYKPGFNPGIQEPRITRVLKEHVEYVTARERGLLGMWATEAVINKVNFKTGRIINERRTDIVYGWNDATQSIQLVFEFKRLDRRARSREHYLGQDGLLRFVTGTYSRQQAVAAMVGILLDPHAYVVPPLCNQLCDQKIVRKLRLRTRAKGVSFDRPSILFPARADFDTEHNRPSGLGPSHGTIRVAHLFLEFGYSKSSTTKRTSIKKPARKK